MSCYAVPGPGFKTFYRCRTNQSFEIERCPCSAEVIRVNSADVGFTEQCPLTEANCLRPANHPDIVKCNGQQRGCKFGPSVLDYPPSDKLCEQSQNGNFINITYECMNGEYHRPTSLQFILSGPDLFRFASGPDLAGGGPGAQLTWDH